MAIVGDSHTSDLFAAFNRIAKAHGWKLYTFVKADCPFIDVEIDNAATGDPYPACSTWNQNVLAQLKKIKPNLTVTIPFRWITPMHGKRERDGDRRGDRTHAGPAHRSEDRDRRLRRTRTSTCRRASRRTARTRARSPSRRSSRAASRPARQEAARVAGGHYVNLTGKMCAGFPCRVVTGNVLEFRDRHHLTNTYAKAFSGTLNDAIKAALGI